jgi:hypothetical protein
MYTKRWVNKISFLSVMLTVLMVVSCKSGNKTGDDQIAADSLNKDLLASDIKAVLYPLPAPFELTKMLNDIGAKYSSKILNPAVNAEKYVTEQKKALNLGVYAADLSYAATFQQQQDIQTYLSSIKTLADELGVTYDYSKLLSDDYKTKFENKDSLTNIITNTIYDTYQYLEQKSNPDLAVDMVAGVWVELMYIATNISEDSYNFTGIVDIISKQKDSYEKVMSLLTARNGNADIKDLETRLSVLKPVFDKVDQGLTQADYAVILKTIKEVRNSLI